MIIDKNDLEVWMISLIDNDIADLLRDITIPKWENEGFKVNLFNAITPINFNKLEHKINFKQKHRIHTKNIVDFTETEKANWYSHLYLWKKSFTENKTLLIIEEDNRPTKKIPSKFKVSGLLQISPQAGAYIIRPILAENIFKNAIKQNITYNVDHYIESSSINNEKKFYANAIDTQKRGGKTLVEHIK
jgi:hypothetical protein